MNYTEEDFEAATLAGTLLEPFITERTADAIQYLVPGTGNYHTIGNDAGITPPLPTFEQWKARKELPQIGPPPSEADK